MTIKELKEVLDKFPEDLEVVLCWDSGYCFTSVQDIGLDKERLILADNEWSLTEEEKENFVKMSEGEKR